MLAKTNPLFQLVCSHPKWYGWITLDAIPYWRSQWPSLRDSHGCFAQQTVWFVYLSNKMCNLHIPHNPIWNACLGTVSNCFLKQQVSQLREQPIECGFSIHHGDSHLLLNQSQEEVWHRNKWSWTDERNNNSIYQMLQFCHGYILDP